MGGLAGADLGEPRDRPAYDREQHIESGYSVKVSDIRRFPLSTFPQEMLDLHKDIRNFGEKEFSSLEDAEQFMGVNLAENPVLERLTFQTATVGCLDWIPAAEWHPKEGTSRFEVRTGYRMDSPDMVEAVIPVRNGDGDGELIEITTTAPAVEIYMGVTATLYTEVYDSLETGDVLTSYDMWSESGSDITMTSHTTPGGVEIPIARFYNSISENGIKWEAVSYAAHFAVDGILYRIETGGHPEEEVLSLLEEVLDGYETASSGEPQE